MNVLHRLDARLRRTGADLPGIGDPRRSHGAEMEGYFWRLTDVAGQRVVVVLCGINRHPEGDWATVAVALHPGGVVESTVMSGAEASPDELRVTAGDGAFRADESTLHVEVGNVTVDISIEHAVAWPLRLGGGGIFSALPYLGQYWHPHVLGGQASATVHLGAETWTLDSADVYAEKNWGAGFPESWWWGQAQGFDRSDVCVAFGGGVLTAGPLRAHVGGVVVRIGNDVLRLCPPFARVHSEVGDDTWYVVARSLRQRVEIRGHGVGAAHVLPVPLPAQRRNIDTDREHLAGHVELTLVGRVDFHGTSELAALEIGHRPTVAEQRRDLALVASPGASG